MVGASVIDPAAAIVVSSGMVLVVVVVVVVVAVVVDVVVVVEHVLGSAFVVARKRATKMVRGKRGFMMIV